MTCWQIDGPWWTDFGQMGFKQDNGGQMYVPSNMQQNSAKNKSGCFVSRSELSQTQLPFDVQNNWPAMTTVYNTQQPSKMLTTESRNVLIKWCNSNRSAKFPCQNLPEQVGLKELPCGSEIPQKRRVLCWRGSGLQRKYVTPVPF